MKNLSKQNKLLVGAGAFVLVFVLGLVAYSQSEHKKRIEEARADYLELCGQATDAQTAFLGSGEIDGVLERAGVNPDLYRMRIISPSEVNAALKKAGLLEEFGAAFDRDKASLQDAYEQQDECDEKRERAKTFLEKHNALPSVP
jgi:hypothetical protein